MKKIFKPSSASNPSTNKNRDVKMLQDCGEQDEMFIQAKQFLKINQLEHALRIVNLDSIQDQCDYWSSLLPSIQPYYAVKCFTDLQVVKKIAQNSFGFDCCSKAEIQLVLDANVEANKIIYAHPCKPESHLLFAKQNGVDLMTFDNIFELEKISRVYAEARLILRLEVQDGGSAFPLQKKFGTPADEAIELLRKAKELGLSVVGVSFHVGCDATEPKAYSAAMSLALKLIEEGNKIFDRPMEILDIGGGFPGRESKLFNEIADEIKSVSIPSSIKIIAEPGRYFVAKCLSVYAPVFGKRIYKGNTHYHIMDGFYGTLGPDAVRFMIPVPMKATGEIIAKEFLTQESIVWGPTCDSLDVLVKSALLPELEFGDLISFHEVGAYTVCISTNFCGFPSQILYYSPRNNFWFKEK